MQSFEAIESLRRQVREWRQAGQSIAFVPTMGNLHDGHMALITHARTLADRVIASIYINPLQFNNAADLDSYPQTLTEDCRRLRTVAADALYLPDAKQLYPYGMTDSVRVIVPGMSDILDGAFRPGHFTGVTTVVAKLFNIVQPDIAVFGDKDLQQLLLVRRMVADLMLPLQVVGVATVREADGLAMSSRNGYLSATERARAGLLYQVLSALREQWRRCDEGQCDYRALEQMAMAELERQGWRPEYVSIRRGQDLVEPEPGASAEQGGPLYVLAAAWLGTTRLIDNIPL